MGRLSRHRKIKSFDPFNPKKSRKVENAERPEKPVKDKREMPRNLERILKAKEFVFNQKRAVAAAKNETSDDDEQPKKKEEKKPSDPSTEPALPTKLLPGETIHAFNQRVDIAASQLLQSRLVVSRTVSEKRKQYLKERKLKATKKRKPSAVEDVPESKKEAVRESIRFGDVAQDVPHFTALPRLKKASPVNSTITTTNNNKSSSNETSTRSAADKRILETERSRVISIYRQLKAKRMLEKPL